MYENFINFFAYYEQMNPLFRLVSKGLAERKEDKFSGQRTRISIIKFTERNKKKGKYDGKRNKRRI